MKLIPVVLAVLVLAFVVVRLSWRAPSNPAPTTSPWPEPPAPIAAAPDTGLAGRLAAAERELAALRERNAALEREVETLRAQAGSTLVENGDRLTFSLGTARESGRFVGETLRRDLEAALSSDPAEARRLREENRLNLLSLGPYIREAERIESDPVRFAEFQGALVQEMLGIEPKHEMEVEVLLEAFKAQSLRVEPGSAIWAYLDQGVRERVAALLTTEEQGAKAAHLRYFAEHGMLFIPAYSALKEPSP